MKAAIQIKFGKRVRQLREERGKWGYVRYLSDYCVVTYMLYAVVNETINDCSLFERNKLNNKFTVFIGRIPIFYKYSVKII